MIEQVVVGPFTFTWRADGDDEGVGSVLLEAGLIRSETTFEVTRYEWVEFLEALKR